MEKENLYKKYFTATIIGLVAGIFGGVLSTFLLLNFGSSYLNLTHNNDSVSTAQISYNLSEDQTVNVVEKANKAVVSVIISKDI